MKYIKHGWPEHARNVPVQIHDLYRAGLQLSVVDNMLVYRNRIVIPTTLRPDILSRIHEGHMGISKCKERAQTTVWWPGIGHDIERKVTECLFSMENKHNQHKEPVAATIPTDTPVRQPVPPARAAADPYVTRSGRTVVRPARFREN